MAELFKFRCYQCQKLIGAPPSKYGKVVKCPKCEAELIVPSPDGAEPSPDSADPDAFRPEDFGINLETERLTPPKPAPSMVTGLPAVGPDPIAFLKKVADSPAPEFSTQPAPPPAPESRNEPNDLEVLPEPPVEPLVARGRSRSGSIRVESQPRARDVVLPRTAAVAWTLSTLLGLAFAFIAGLLLGHFLWK